MAGGKDNLIPAAHKLTREEQVAGGKASVAARRRKKDLRRALEDLLIKEYKMKDGTEITGTDALAAKLMERGMKGDVRAFITIRDTIGQMPIQKIETTVIDDETRREIEDFIDGCEETENPPETQD